MTPRGGLHGVGASVVNALSEWMEVEVARDKHAHKMRFERGHAVGKLKDLGAVNRRGTIVTFKPDAQDFRQTSQFSPARLYRMAQVQGLSVPRRGNPLELRSVADQGRNARPKTC